MTEKSPAAPEPAAGWWQQPPRWLGRGVVLVLVMVAAFQLVLWLFSGLSTLLGILFLAWMFAISIEPVVNRLEQRGWRRGLATGLVMLVLALVVLGFTAVFGALLVQQLAQLFHALPTVVGEVVRRVNHTFGTTFDPNHIADSLGLTSAKTRALIANLTPGVVGLVASIVGLVFQAFTLLLFAFYASAEAPKLRRTVSSWFPPKQQQVIVTVWAIAVDKTGGYVVSRLVLAALSAFFTGIFLLLLGVPFWLPLAIWTGLVSQFIPTIGTYLAIALPALIALTVQPLDALWVILFGTGYQQVENYLFAPRVSARTMQIHPAVAFGAVIAGAALFGPVGALVSIPVVAAIQALVETYGHRYELIAEAAAPAGPPRAARASRPRLHLRRRR